MSWRSAGFALAFAFAIQIIPYNSNGQTWPSVIPIGQEAKAPTMRMIADNFNHSKPNLTIPFLALYGGFIFPLGDLCETSAQLALNKAAEKNVLKNYNLVIDVFDEKCDSALGIRLSVELFDRAKTTYKNMPPIILGPSCTASKRVGQFIKHFNFITGIEHTAHTIIFQEREAYRNSFVFSASPFSSFVALPHFIKANGWKNIFLLSDSLSLWIEVSLIVLLMLST